MLLLNHCGGQWMGREVEHAEAWGRRTFSDAGVCTHSSHTLMLGTHDSPVRALSIRSQYVCESLLFSSALPGNLVEAIAQPSCHAVSVYPVIPALLTNSSVTSLVFEITLNCHTHVLN